MVQQSSRGLGGKSKELKKGRLGVGSTLLYALVNALFVLESSRSYADMASPNLKSVIDSTKSSRLKPYSSSISTVASAPSASCSIRGAINRARSNGMYSRRTVVLPPVMRWFIWRQRLERSLLRFPAVEFFPSQVGKLGKPR